MIPSAKAGKGTENISPLLKQDFLAKREFIVTHGIHLQRRNR
jgi:hypothetical protein